jgi:hypothetical protein
VVKAKKNFYILKKNLSSNERENGKIDTHLCLCEMGQFFFFFLHLFFSKKMDLATLDWANKNRLKNIEISYINFFLKHLFL